MSLYEISEPVVEPISLEEAKNHLRISPDFFDDDALISVLISGARSEAESKTGGRVFAQREWEWIPEDTLKSFTEYEIPISPVTGISIIDTTTNTTVSSDKYAFIPSSLAPYGRPLYARLSPFVDMENVKVKLTAGWPNKSVTKKIKRTDSPIFKPQLTTYTESSISLRFDRKVIGEALPKSFSVLVDEMYIEVLSVTQQNGIITLHFSDELNEGSRVVLSYVSGFLHDEDDNYVLPIMKETLPYVDFEYEETAVSDAGTESVTESSAPKLVKSWMLVRIATLYQQRSEIAIQAGKTSNSFFPRDFVGGLLDAYTIEKA